MRMVSPGAAEAHDVMTTQGLCQPRQVGAKFNQFNEM